MKSALESKIAHYTDRDPFTIRGDKEAVADGHVGRLVAIKNPAVEEPDTSRVLLAGEILSHLRSSLDHLVHELVRLSGNAREAKGQPQTPVSNLREQVRLRQLCEMSADPCLCLDAKGHPARLQFGRERWGGVMDAILDDRRVDPFKDWLEARPPWDGEDRLDFWLGHSFTVGDIHEDLLSWASRSVLMGVVTRTDHPGEKHDEMVVLVGPQGIGKSTAWAWLLPGEPQRSLWFSDGLSFHDDQKTTAEALQGMVLVDASAMTGSTKAEVETIKKFRSRTTDNIRLTSRRDPSTLLRRCMIVGTTNDPRCLPTDASGNRRFLPVPCTKGGPGAHTGLPGRAA